MESAVSSAASASRLSSSLALSRGVRLCWPGGLDSRDRNGFVPPLPLGDSLSSQLFNADCPYFLTPVNLS